MFSEKKVTTLKNFLGLKQRDNATLFTYRLKKFLEANAKIENGKVEIEQGAVLNGIVILLENLHKQEKSDAKEKIKVNLKNIKHPTLRKYGAEIIKLNEEGLGARSIKKLLELEYNAKVSHTAIHNFLKQQNPIKKD